MEPAEILLLVLMAVGVVGVVIPILPGLLIVLAAVLIWALLEQSTLGWVLLGLSVLVYVSGVVLQYAVPGKRMKRAGVRTSTLLVGVACALVLGFVLPVVGLFLGFPLGIFLVSLARTRDRSEAWVATRHALHAVGTNILIELLTAFALIGLFVVTTVVLDRA